MGDVRRIGGHATSTTAPMQVHTPFMKLVISLGACLSLSACGNTVAPVISSITPSSAHRGDTVQLTGSGFCTAAASDASQCASLPAGGVTFGIEDIGIEAEIVSWQPTTASAVVPSLVAVGTEQLIITVDGNASNAIDFTVLPDSP